MNKYKVNTTLTFNSITFPNIAVYPDWSLKGYLIFLLCDILGSYLRASYLRYFDGKHLGHIFLSSKFLLDRFEQILEQFGIQYSIDNTCINKQGNSRNKFACKGSDCRKSMYLHKPFEIEKQ